VGKKKGGKRAENRDKKIKEKENGEIGKWVLCSENRERKNNL
jgi:hypothetical protein